MGYTFKMAILADETLNTWITNIYDKYPRTPLLPINWFDEPYQIYWFQVTLSYFIQIRDLQFLAQMFRNPTNFKPLFFRDSSLLVLTSETWKITSSHLEEVKDVMIFELLHDNPTVVILSRSEDEQFEEEKYFELISGYVDQLKRENFYFKYVTKETIAETMEKLNQLAVLKFPQINNDNSTIFSICGICRNQGKSLRFVEDKIICDTCKIEDFDENKLRAWYKIHKN